jgi:hypothetical protein
MWEFPGMRWLTPSLRMVQIVYFTTQVLHWGVVFTCRLNLAFCPNGQMGSRSDGQVWEGRPHIKELLSVSGQTTTIEGIIIKLPFNLM